MMLKSQRLLRKGALVEEAYEASRNWCWEKSVSDNLDAIFAGRFKTDSWNKEVKFTLRLRFQDVKLMSPLIVLAKKGLSLNEWRLCLLLVITAREFDYREFVTRWLFVEYKSGRYRIRTEDVVPFLQIAWKESRGELVSLTEYGAKRTARDLLRMARDLGVLTGAGPVKEFASLSLTDEVFLFACHWIAEMNGGTGKVASSDLWRTFLLDQDEVETELLRLHQYRKLEYHVAGSLVQLDLPCRTALEYAERMFA